MAEQASELGLRERKKAATRSALSAAGLRLAVERGLDNVRVDEIAAEAGVSLRTFNNYFSSKEQAIAANATERAEAFAAALRARPKAEPLWDALVHVVKGLFPNKPDRAWLARARLVREEPALLAEKAKADVAVERELAYEIASRMGMHATRDLYPRLAAAAVVAAVHVALDGWLAAPKATKLHAVLASALRQIAHLEKETKRRTARERPAQRVTSPAGHARR